MSRSRAMYYLSLLASLASMSEYSYDDFCYCFISSRKDPKQKIYLKKEKYLQDLTKLKLKQNYLKKQENINIKIRNYSERNINMSKLGVNHKHLNI